MIKKIFYSILLLLFAFSLVTLADNHDTNTDTAVETETTQTSDKVIVSALKKETDLQETSVAVTAISSEAIEERGIRDLEDAQFSAPGVYFSQGVFTGAEAVIRGIGSYTRGASFSGNVTYRFDDSNLTSAWFADGELFDVKQFEILRGPQGTLYGGNSPAGTFNVNSYGPADNHDNYFKSEFGEYNLRRYTTAFNVPLGNFASTRLAIRSSEHDGYVENLATNMDIDNYKFIGVRSKTELYLTDRLTGYVTLYHNSRDDNSARTSKAGCTSNPLFGCDPYGPAPGVGDVLNSSSVYFSAVDIVTHVYPGSGLGSNILNNIYENTVIPDDLYEVSYDFTPEKTVDNNLGSLKLHWNFDNHDIFATYSAYHHQYDSYGKLNDIDASEDYMNFVGLGNSITADIFGLGEQTYTKDSILDWSHADNTEQSFELRIESSLNNKTDYTAGLYWREYESHTVYAVNNPGLEYFGDVSKGPIGTQFSELAGFGGTNFWLTFTGTYLTNITAAITQSAIDYVMNDPNFTTQITALIQQLLANGMCNNPNGDCFQLASNILVINAVSLPSVQIAGGQAAATIAKDAVLTADSLGQIKSALPAWQRGFTSSDYVTNIEKAIFAEMDHELNSKWSVRVGGRLNYIEKIQTSWSGASDINHLTAITDVYATEEDYLAAIPEKSAEFDDFTGRVIFDYKHSDTKFYYFGYNRGLKAGGFNPATDIFSTAVTEVDAEIHNLWEIGHRSTSLDGSMSYSLHLYTNAVEGMQLQRLSGLATETFNSDTTLNGLEFEFSVQATDKLQIDGNVAINDATIDGFSTVNPRNPYGSSELQSSVSVVDLGVISGATDTATIYRSLGYICDEPFSPLTGVNCPNSGVEQDLSGNKLPGVPDYSYRLGATYSLASMFNGLLKLRTDYIKTGPSYISPFNEERSKIEDYDLVNMSLHWTMDSGKRGIAFSVFNVANNDVIVGGSNSSQVNGGIINYYNLRPQSYSFSMFVNFN
ncbi:hypothetical protein DID76_00090 [Candidatus Marinamargulisbacteria bacterium SCGC AG-414-C22]|nr:hypothetical protein DID76_00090 [Candidatus Marinamargulisbacteria bacterium SCGC AG-414-C22]